MFNALNRFMSRLDGGDTPQRNQEQGSFGFQVLRNTNLQLAVEPWFDYIVGINGRPIETPDASLFAMEIRNCAGGNVSLGLWNAKGQRTRELHVSVPANTASLGLSLQYAPIALAANIWHILDVPVNSPADVAGLIPYSDYILGSPEGSMQGEGALGEIVEDYIGRPLRLYVYNNEYNVTREVTITPSRSWGGQGAIGCTLGYGALHRLPAPLSEPISAPGETMFDGGAGGKSSRHTPAPVEASDGALSNESSYVVPAEMVATSGTPPVDGLRNSSTPTPGPPRGPKKERHAPKNNSFMEDYFKEQEAKSHEMDHVPQKAAAGVSPPPKLGAPPKVGETLG